MELKKTDKEYPGKLLMHLKNPQDIFYKGDINLVNRPAIAVVGSRKCTKYGEGIATAIGEAAANNGVVLVSGMAMGIDGAAHRGAIKAGGKTIAVLGTGTDIIYPKTNRDIYEIIAKDHLLLSEYPDGSEGMAFNFPVRNRIISALAEAVIVVESASRGGSLITAECAIEQGKEVYAVPGNINSVYSLGTNKLIYDGVKPLVFIDQVFNELGLNKKKDEKASRMGKAEAIIYREVLKRGEISISALCEILEMKPNEINPIISILEIKGAVYCELGKVMVANFS